jgi:hypothetical protein
LWFDSWQGQVIFPQSVQIGSGAPTALCSVGIEDSCLL